jgi:geranylgeranyl diphosphate synthase type I
MGICAGDVAYFLAFELIAGADVTPGVRAALLALAARELTSVGVAQMQDVAWGGTPASAEEADILRMYTYKTSRYSFSLPLRAGAMAAGADPALQARLDEIGETIGVLFQVRDDELGLFGDEKEIGKPVGSDVREGKKTVYWTRLMAAAAGADRDRLAATFGSREAGPADLAFVRGRAESLGVRAGIDAAMRALRERAESLIAAVSTGSPADRSALRDLLDFALARTL